MLKALFLMSAITVNSFVIPNYQGGGSTATLRIYADQKFQTSDGVQILRSRPGGSVWYESVACTVSGTNITVPSFILDSNTDSNVPTSSYTGVVFDSNTIWKDYLFKHYIVPHDSGSPIAFSTIVTYNTDTLPSTTGDTYLLTGYLQRAVTTAVQDFNSTTTLTNTELTASLVTGARYAYRAEIPISAGAGGVKLFFSSTGTPLSGWHQAIIYDRSTGAVAAVSISYNAVAVTVASTGEYLAVLSGGLEWSTNGTFVIQAAQNSSNVATTRIFRNSHLITTRLN